MKYPFSKPRGLDSKAAGEIAVEVTKDMVTAATDPFIIDFTAVLENQLQELALALAQSRQVELTEEAAELHKQIKKDYVNIRRILRAVSQAGVLGAVASAADDIYDMFERHGGALETLPRHAMLTALDNFKNEIAEDHTQIELAGVLPIYSAMNKTIHRLKSKENERNETALEEGAVLCESKASLQVNNTVRTLFNHIEDYAGIEKEGYADLLAEFEVKLAPIFIQIKARETRHQHEQEAAAELNEENQENDNEIEDTGETEE